MGAVVEIPQAHVVIQLGKDAHVVPVLLIKRIMTGEMSIAEHDDPELFARLMAKFIIEVIEGYDGRKEY